MSNEVNARWWIVKPIIPVAHFFNIFGAHVNYDMSLFMTCWFTWYDMFVTCWSSPFMICWFLPISNMLYNKQSWSLNQRWGGSSIITLLSSLATFHRTRYRTSIIILELQDSLLMGNTHVVCCRVFDKQLWFIGVLQIATSSFRKRPSSSCLVLLWYTWIIIIISNEM